MTTISGILPIVAINNVVRFIGISTGEIVKSLQHTNTSVVKLV